MVNPFEGEPELQDSFEFLGTIGSGGMGVIYKARMHSLNKLVAIKMVHQHLVFDDTLRRFQIEAQATAKLSHPGIVKLVDFSATTKGQPFIIMDLVDGENLSQLLSREGHLSKDRFIKIFSQVCDALSHAHKRGVLHRDLKPSNIMIRPNDEIRLMDFGIAKIVGDSETMSQNLTKTGEAIGSPIYMSQEQARGAKVDQRSDLYSLGCVMYEALSGTPPFVGGTPIDTMLMHLNDDVMPLREASLGLNIDPALESLVMALLKKSPEERCQSADEAAKILNKAGQAPAETRLADVVSHTKNQPKSPNISGNHNHLIWIAGILILGISTFAIMMLVGKHELEAPPKFISTIATINAQKPSNESTTSDSTSGTTTTTGATAEGDDTKTKAAKADYPPVPEMIEEYLMANKTELNLSEMVKLRQEPLKESDFTSIAGGIRIRDLDLAGCGVKDAWLKKLNPLKLEILDLSENPEIKNPTSVQQQKTLRKLSLDHTSVGADAIKMISHLPKLETLSLSRTSIRPSDLKPLQASHLEELNLHACRNLSKEDISSLRKKLPNCKVMD